MSDENNATPAEEAPISGSVRQAVAVLSEISDRVKQSGGQVRQLLVDNLVSKEVNERVDLLNKGLTKRIEADREVKKASKPDVEAFDASGKSVSCSFSKQQVEALKKAREQLGKLDNALDKALADNDFSKLKDMCK